MAKHTPGPWVRQGQGIVLHPVSGRSIITERIEADNWGIIGEWADSSNETAANARLIAAAPDMLEALRSILRSAPDWAELSGQHKTELLARLNIIASKAQDAIRKAAEE